LDNAIKELSFWIFGVIVTFQALHYETIRIDSAYDTIQCKSCFDKRVITSKRFSTVYKKVLSLLSKHYHESSESNPTKLLSLLSLLCSSDSSDSSGPQAQMRGPIQWLDFKDDSSFVKGQRNGI